MPDQTSASIVWREMVNKNAIDILDNFGEACREEFRSLHMRTV